MIKVSVAKFKSFLETLDTRSKWILFLTLVLAIYLIRAFFLRFILQGDSAELIRGSNVFYNCWVNNLTFNCPGADQFPWLQRIFILPMMLFTKDGHNIGRFLAGISFISFLGIFFVAARAFANRRHSFLLFTLVMISSPFLYYSRTTFGESLATFACLIFTYVCIKRMTSGFLFASFVFASLSKEIMVPFLVVIFVSCYFTWKDYFSFKDFLKQIFASKMAVFSIFSATVVSVALTFMQNLSRYGVIDNVAYGAEAYKYSSLKTYFSFFAGLWFAPNSGILFFWFSAFVLMLSSVVLISRNVLRTPFSMIPAVSALFLNFVANAGLAKWWAPFGWIAWGPRLSLTFLAVGIFILVFFYGEQLLDVLRKIRNGRIILVSVFLFFSMSQFAVLKHTETFASMIVEPIPPDCPKMAIIEESKEYYYRCMELRMWKPRHFVIFETYRRHLTAEKIIGTLMFGALLFLMLKKLSLGGQRLSD